MSTSSGWPLRSALLEAAPDRSVIAADQGITADAPFGEIEAERMRLAPGEGEGSAILNFSGGVRLLYQP